MFFTNSGSEANDTALMLATGVRQSNQVLAIRNSYHGRSFSAVAVTGIRSWSVTSLSPIQVTYVHGGYKYRSPFRASSRRRVHPGVRAGPRRHARRRHRRQCCLHDRRADPGCRRLCRSPDGFFGEFKKVLDRHGILFISDEVQTGWGRTGENFWGYQSHGVVPDMLTFAKGLGNGWRSGVIARAEIMDSFTANSISTFGGNPLAMAGALANLDYLLEHDLQTNASKVGRHLKSAIEDMGEKHDIIGEVRGKGLMIGVETGEVRHQEPNAAAASGSWRRQERAGLLVGKGGLNGNCLRIAPRCP